MTMKRISRLIAVALSAAALCSCADRSDDVRHIILWTFADGLTQEEKDAVLDRLEDTVAELEDKVPGAVDFKLVYKGRMESSNCDFMFDFVFEDEAALKAFSTNPDHKAAQAELKPYLKGRVCLDVAR